MGARQVTHTHTHAPRQYVNKYLGKDEEKWIEASERENDEQQITWRKHENIPND